MTALFAVAIIILFLSQLNLRKRIEKLESQKNFSVKDQSKTTLSPMPIPKPEFNVANVGLPDNYQAESFTPTTVALSEEVVKSAEAKSELFIYTWFKDHTLIKIGGLFFFLGMAWFVSYAIKSGWLSPELRIGLGFALALAVYALAYHRSKSVVTEYLVLTALGTGIVCATVSAAQIVFAMFNPVLALAILGLAISYTVYVATVTNTNWLIVVSAIAGLLVPSLIASTASPIWLLLYLLMLAIGFILVAVKMEIRAVTLLMLIGVTGYQLALVDSVSAATLWLFVLVFSAIFFASITKSVTTSGRALGLDITTFVWLGISFVSFASELTTSPSLAIFMATFIVGMTGYLLTKYHQPIGVISLFIAGAGAGVLVGTSFLFSGYTEVLVYTIEITAAFMVATYLGLPSRVVSIIVLSYLLPLLSSLALFASDSWNDGVWHADALAVLAVGASLFVSMLWLIHKPEVAVYRWSKVLAAIFGSVGFFYTYALIGVFMGAIFEPLEATVATYVLFAIQSLVFVFYSLEQKFPSRVLIYSSLSLALPLLISLGSFSAPAWTSGLKHPDGFGVLAIMLVMLLTTLVLTQQYCKDYDSTLRRVIGVMIITQIGYLFIFFHVLWHGLLTTSSVAAVATYASYGWTLYFLTSLFILLRVSSRWVGFSLSALAIPTLLALPSFAISGWPAGPLSPQAVGIFSLILVFVLLALGLRKHYDSEKSEDEKKVLAWGKLLLSLALAFSVGLVWSLAHTALAEAGAISTALFIYTITGLVSYQYGKKMKKSDFRYAGVALLSIVVGRLILIDVWNMELIWRVVTFLGIGSLFIATALFDRGEIK